MRSEWANWGLEVEVAPPPLSYSEIYPWFQGCIYNFFFRRKIINAYLSVYLLVFYCFSQG